jgi:aspartyl-tRNA(Asn)/glutamyl-tRNA(Gln) amidotransferase subunit A
MTDLPHFHAARAIREKKVSSVEATTAAIKRMKDCHELTNCVVTLEADEALAAAKAADAAVAKGSSRGALTGVPLAHKDMFDRKGTVASWGAKIRATSRHQDSTAIARFKASGALQIAALHLPSSPTARLGTTRHRPLAIPGTPRAPGGSSRNGSQCRLRRDPGRPRPDTEARCGRRPRAAACSIADLGAYQPRRRMPPRPLDTVGVLARHVEDLALAGRPRRPRRRDPRLAPCRCPTTSPTSTTP